MTKLDLKKQFSSLYAPSAKTMSVVDVPPMNFLMVDGEGNPNSSPAYADAVQALYAVAYGLKFKLKRDEGVDFGVMPLEGMWWADDPAVFSARKKDTWQWTMMIMQPEAITPSMFEGALADARKKKPDVGALRRVRFETCREGTSAQILFIGAYDDEGPTIAHLHEFIVERGGRLRGKHHEIYLGDPRKTAPAKLKTVIRQPFQA